MKVEVTCRQKASKNKVKETKKWKKKGRGMEKNWGEEEETRKTRERNKGNGKEKK